jgi:4-carboxymuconolactone decarboxylase
MRKVLPRVAVLAAFSSAAAWADQPLTDDQINEICTQPALTAPVLADRMPPILAANLTPAQIDAQIEFTKTRKEEGSGPVFGPYVDLLRSPEVLTTSVSLGNYLQFRSILDPKIRQFIMAITSRQWSQQYMWSIHCPGALKAGLDPEIARALAEGRRPVKMQKDEEIVYDFLDELHRNQSVSDATYEKAREKFGEQGIIDMIAMNGYYTYLAMVLNATRHPVSSKLKPGLPTFPH